jgi:hypothetical protein
MKVPQGLTVEQTNMLTVLLRQLAGAVTNTAAADVKAHVYT